MKINALNCCCPPKKQTFKQKVYLNDNQKRELNEFKNSGWDTWDKLERLKVDNMILKDQNERILRALQCIAYLINLIMMN